MSSQETSQAQSKSSDPANSQQSSSQSSSQRLWSDPDARSGNKDFSYRGSGVNDQGNHYCARDYGPDAPNQNSYHYSNKDGGYYYSNPNGSTYYNDGKGTEVYAPPDKDAGKFVSRDGQGWEYAGPQKNN